MTEEETKVNDFNQQEYPLITNNVMGEFASVHGIDLSKPITRGDLLGSGWVMMNMVGHGERTIIQGCRGEDWRNKALLTKEELKRHQEESTPEGVTKVELNEIEKDMEQLIDKVQKLTLVDEHLGGQRGTDWFNNYIDVYLHNHGLTDKARKVGMHEYSEKLEFIKAAQETVRQNYDVPQSIRGIPLKNFERRREGHDVVGTPCQLLSCEHHLSSNGGIMIFDEDGKITGKKQMVRINSVVAHLASHGISNTGDPEDPSQRYISIKEYKSLFDIRENDPDLTKLNDKEIMLEVFMKAITTYLEKLGVNVSIGEIEKEARVSYFFMEEKQ